MTNLRVAVISVHTSPLSQPGSGKAGGLNVYVRELTKRLAERGCTIDIFSRATSASTPMVTELAPGLRAIHLRVGPARNLGPESIHRYINSFEEAMLAFCDSEGAAYDVIHSHYWLSGLVGESLKQRWDIPHVTMFHTLGEIKNRASLSEHETDLRIQSEARIIAGVERIICATEQERALICQLYDAAVGNIRVVPLGVDLERFQPGDKDKARTALGLADERVILFVGRIEPLKGVDILINAAAMIESDVDCTVLIVGGDASSKAQVEKLRSLAREKGIEHRVAFVGAVDHEKLPLYYSAADVCVIPSHYESFGLVAIEAMASGVPVVASRVGGLTDTVKHGETGYLIPWLCPEPFAERIELLLENEPLRRGLGLTAREAVGRYRWESVTAAVLDVYDELTGRSRELQPAGAAG